MMVRAISLRSFKNKSGLSDVADSSSLYAGGNKVTVAPGASAVITDSTISDFADVNPAQMVLYRRVHSMSLANGMKAFIADFSVPSAMHAVKPIKKLLSAKDAGAKGVAEKLLKTAAALSVVQGSQGNYTQILRRRLTALAH